jgi:membrane-associated protein
MTFGLTLAEVEPADVVLYVFLGTVGTLVVPVPEEVVLLGAGYAASVGRAPVVACIAAGWLAVLIGDSVGYALGRKLLAPMLRTRIGRWILPEPRRMWAERAVHGRGARAIVLARFLVGVRGFLYLAVGASRYPFGRFLLVDALAAAAHVSGLIGMGYAFADLQSRADGGAHLAVAADLVAVVVLVLTLFAPTLVKARLTKVLASRREPSA